MEVLSSPEWISLVKVFPEVERSVFVKKMEQGLEDKSFRVPTSVSPYCRRKLLRQCFVSWRPEQFLHFGD